ncbi:MAG: FeS-binding protein [Armatimonadetes bacterium]|nr:FeS-binding protein [Armatimonadota bacterium]
MAVIQVRIATRTSEQAKEPAIHRVGHDFRVVTNIRRAQVNEEGGFVDLQLEGALEEVQRAIAWLKTTGLSVEARERSVTDGSNL